MWKAIYDSVIGTSHSATGQPCQDACRVIERTSGDDRFLVACCADGAGSAKHSEHGSIIACDTFVDQFDCWLTSRDPSGGLSDIDGMAWIEAVRIAVVAKSQEMAASPKDLATTFLGAVVADQQAFFVQIGDGAIVYRVADADSFSAVFWPQTIEYANTTYFLTDPNYEQHVNLRVDSVVVNELALFTDGLERLALRFVDQTVHDAFLTPMFSHIDATESVETLFEPLRHFLASEAVNSRTDDDRTLVLAMRRSDDDLSHGTP